MDFSTKCSVLGDLWAYYREDIQSSEAWMDFFKYNDVALPLSYMIDREYVTVNEDSEATSFVDETWDMFCEYIDIPEDGEYANLTAAFAASDQPPLNPVVA
jgi:hypothetical protein